MLSRLIDDFVRFMMPLVTFYHLVSASIFLNTSTDNAQGLEKWGNIALIPVHYLLAAEVGLKTNNPDEPYLFQQRFDYHEHLFLKTAGSVIAFPFSLLLGSTIKGAAYLSEDVRKKHTQLTNCRFYPPAVKNTNRYDYLKLDEKNIRESTKISSLGYQRRPGDENKLKTEKEALKVILQLLQEHEIIFWADSGTCLGAYRYGGLIPWDVDIDIGVLQPDFHEIKRILYTLPKDKYLVEDWSNRQFPETLLKVYIRENCEYIDIYHFAVYPEKRTIQFILSNLHSIFMPQSWKNREGRFTVETPYDYVFPLKVADYDGIEIPVPNQIEKYLQQRYGEDLSPAKIYDEKKGEYVKDSSHPYWLRT